MREIGDFKIIWPAYLDLKRSRSEGRRLPKKYAIDKISIKDIVKASRRLGYDVQVERRMRYPRTWWDRSGRVLIDTKGKRKSHVIKEIAKEIKKMRKMS
ncbi:MAG: signal recognition particle subunit SRP19/SEC65 family protein [Promethearchaeia archaeon]